MKILFILVLQSIYFIKEISCVTKQEVVECIDYHPKFQNHICPDQKTKGMSKQAMNNYLSEVMNKKIFSVLKRFGIVPNVEKIMKNCGNEKQDCITFHSTMENNNCMPNWIEKKIAFEYFKCDNILKNKRK